VASGEALKLRSGLIYSLLIKNSVFWPVSGRAVAAWLSCAAMPAFMRDMLAAVRLIMELPPAHRACPEFFLLCLFMPANPITSQQHDACKYNTFHFSASCETFL
jgi:hypothetical protein